MQNFFYGGNAETKYGSGAGIVLSGSDWLGIGQAVGSTSVGTAMCGAKPNCWSSISKDCTNRKDEYYKCVERSLQISSSQVTGQQKTAEELARAKRNKVVIIVVASVIVVLVLGLALIKRKRKE